MKQAADELIQLLIQLGPLNSTRLQALMGISQPTVSRLIRQTRGRVLRFGKGRSTKYAASQSAFGSGDRIPLYSISASGQPVQLADLRPLAGGGYLIESDINMPFWLLGERGNGHFDGLPYFLDDLRPQGFLGRQIAHALAPTSEYPEDPRRWSEQHIGNWLVHESNDLPGNLLLGNRALNRFEQHDSVLVHERTMNYPLLVEHALSGETPGSSAGGEQQKFMAFTEDRGQVLVKFSPAGKTIDAIRWRDLLIAEHHTLAILRKIGFEGVHGRLYSIGDRVYLETQRFDRQGNRGCHPAISLAAIDAEYTGLGQGWSRVAAELQATGCLNKADLRSIIWLHTFGEWIGNSDMHLGNLSLRPESDKFRLLPVYDMLPMGFAPVRGELVTRTLRAPVPTLESTPVWQQTGETALRFWRTITDDLRISPEFRKLAEDCISVVATAIA